MVSGVFSCRRPSFFVPSWRWGLEFSVQVGTGGHGARSACSGPTRRFGRRYVQRGWRADLAELPAELAPVRIVRHFKMRQPTIIVVGGGLAGLMATIRVAEAGVPVDLFSIVPVKGSHSVCAAGGLK